MEPAEERSDTSNVIIDADGAELTVSGGRVWMTVPPLARLEIDDELPYYLQGKITDPQSSATYPRYGYGLQSV